MKEGICKSSLYIVKLKGKVNIMKFNEILGIKEIEDNMKINNRIAVRAVIPEGNKILMVHSNKGDYKFPGGGVHKGEKYKDALKREIEEETGCVVNNVKDVIGTIVERKKDELESNAVFQMTSYYYLCEVSDRKTSQRLDDYEAELDFSPEWISLDDAISENEKALKNAYRNAWTYRETLALKQLKNCL